MRWIDRLQQIMKGQRQAGFWARWLWGWRTSVSILSCQLWSFFSVEIWKSKGFSLFFPCFCDVWGQSCVLQCRSWSLKVSGEEDVCLLILQFPPALWMNNRQAPETGPHPPLEPASHWLSSSPNVFTVRTSARTEGSCSSVACLEMRSELESSFPGVYLRWCLGAALAYFASYFLSL